MKGQKLFDDSHQKNSNPIETANAALASILDDMALLSNQNQLPIPPTLDLIIGVASKGEAEILGSRVKTLTIEDLCKILSFLVTIETQSDMQKTAVNLSSAVHKARGKDGDHKNGDDHDKNGVQHSRVRAIINLSKAIMEFLDADTASSLPPQQLDCIVLECLLGTYRLPSVANGFESETIAFYDWWRVRIKEWIKHNKQSSSGGNCYHRLGWRHLDAMIRETRDHLRPPPLSVLVRGAGSKDVNGEYKLASGCLANGGNEKQEVPLCYRYYTSSKLTYEKTTFDGRTFSLCLCGVDQSPTSYNATQEGLGRSLWFLTELDEEQPNTDCDIDYYCALPRSGKGKRTNGFPPLGGWKRCSHHGLFPPPRLVPVGCLGNHPHGGEDDVHGQNLARWILEEDILATCWCTYRQPRDDCVESGMASVLGLLMEFYEEEGRHDSGETIGASLGTELVVKFAVSCLEGRTQQRRARKGTANRAAK